MKKKKTNYDGFFRRFSDFWKKKNMNYDGFFSMIFWLLEKLNINYDWVLRWLLYFSAELPRRWGIFVIKKGFFAQNCVIKHFFIVSTLFRRFYFCFYRRIMRPFIGFFVTYCIGQWKSQFKTCSRLNIILIMTSLSAGQW